MNQIQNPNEDERLKVIETVNAATLQLADVMQNLYNLKGERRDATARYLAVVLTELEKVQAYLLVYLVGAQTK